jgi:hypothetical protein
MDKEQGKEIIEIKNQIARQFTKSDWLDLGCSLGCYDIIENHGRLLRSLSFGDEDYEGNILEVLTSIIKQDPKNLQELKHFISDKYSAPIVSEYISTAHLEAPKKMITFSPQVFEIPTKPQNEKLVTVMLPFKLQPSFTAVKNACDKLGLDCKKADDIWENATFIQDIFELIFTSKVVLADFTGKNPNVFYEVGIAHTLGKTVIPITQSFDDVPSDLGHHRALKYLPNEQGYSELTAELMQRLETLIPKPITNWDF